jgi:hypothetical protein
MLDDGLSITSDEPPVPLAQPLPVLPDKQNPLQAFRGHDSVEYVRNSRIYRYYRADIMEMNRGYESA